MTQTVRGPLYRRHRFPAEVMAQAVWLYLRFPLSLRMVEDLLAARRIIVSHQTVRLWVERSGRHFANEIRHRAAGKHGDKLRSYGAAKRDIMPGVEHRSHKGLNNREKNSHQPTRRRERVMKGFKPDRHLQRFVSIHDPFANLFNIQRHDIPSHYRRDLRTTAMQMWNEIARLKAA